MVHPVGLRSASNFNSSHWRRTKFSRTSSMLVSGRLAGVRVTSDTTIGGGAVDLPFVCVSVSLVLAGVADPALLDESLLPLDAFKITSESEIKTIPTAPITTPAELPRESRRAEVCTDGIET